MNTTGRKTVKGRTTSAPKKGTVSAAAKSAKAPGEASASLATDATETSASSEAKPAPTREQITIRAYELFLARGGEPGHEVEDWLAAERELCV